MLQNLLTAGRRQRATTTAIRRNGVCRLLRSVSALIADYERDDYDMRTVGDVCIVTNSASGVCWSLPRLGRGHSGRGEVERGVPDDLPQVAVGILEVSRVDAPRPVVR
jgi:hypothetical protein